MRFARLSLLILGVAGAVPACQRPGYPKFRPADVRVRGPLVAAPAEHAAPSEVAWPDAADSVAGAWQTTAPETPAPVAPLNPNPVPPAALRSHMPNPLPPPVAPPPPPPRAGYPWRALRAVGIGLGVGTGGAVLLGLSLGAAPLTLGLGLALSVLFLLGGGVVLGVRKLARRRS